MIPTKLEEPFKNVINKYLLISLLPPKLVFFMANGKLINQEDKVKNQINQVNLENRKVTLLVYLIEIGAVANDSAKSKDIICPTCYEPCRIKTENCKISLFGCDNNHITNLKITDFLKTQKINKIKTKSDCPSNEFYKCLTCNINLCLYCKSFHEQNHNIINYDQKNYICNKHYEPFIRYCKQCNKNICFICEDEHEEHDMTSLSEIKPNINEINNYLTEMKKEIDIFITNIKDIINKLNELSDIINIFYEINTIYCIINNIIYKYIN
jgi:hypothetical protein